LGFGVVSLERSDLVVNATTVGETDDNAIFEFDIDSVLAPGVRYFDLNNRASAVQLKALGAGCVVTSGVIMQIVTNALRVALLGETRDAS
jgi:hypothetical protein